MATVATEATPLSIAGTSASIPIPIPMDGMSATTWDIVTLPSPLDTADTADTVTGSPTPLTCTSSSSSDSAVRPNRFSGRSGRVTPPSSSPLMCAATAPTTLQLHAHSMLALYKHGNTIHRSSVGYGSDNDVVLREEKYGSERSSASGSESDQMGRTRLSRLTPNNISGTRSRMPTSTDTVEIDIDKRQVRKAGIRRRRRWMNDYFIEEQLSHLLPQDMEAAKREWLELFVPEHTSQFQLLLEDTDAMAAFEPFLETTLAKQSKALRKISKKDPEWNAMQHNRKLPATQHEQYQSLCAAGRAAIRKAVKVPSKLPSQQFPDDTRSDVLSHIEYLIRQYIRQLFSSDGAEVFSVVLPDAFHRLVFHSTAEYYELSSHSHRTKNQRTTRLLKKNETSRFDEWYNHPKTLFQYIQNLEDSFDSDDEKSRKLKSRSMRSSHKRKPQTFAPKSV